MKPRIKICCISSIKEARMAVDYEASAIGLVGHMPSGPGVIDDELIFKIAGSVPPPVATFLLTSETSSKEIIKHHELTRTNTIQIVDELNEGSTVSFDTVHGKKGPAATNVKLIKSD